MGKEPSNSRVQRIRGHSRETHQAASQQNLAENGYHRWSPTQLTFLRLTG